MCRLQLVLSIQFIHVALQCSGLLPPQYGQIKFTGSGAVPFDYRTTATYSCDSGFILAIREGDSVSVCGSNGTACDPVRVCGGTNAVGEWSGQSLVCTLEGSVCRFCCEKLLGQ